MTTTVDPWAITEHDEAQALPWYADTREASRDMTGQLDELAVVQVAADGHRMRLRRPERDEAVRRMYGRVELDLIAWRLCTTTRTVHRVAARLGLTEHRTAQLTTTSAA